LSHPDRARTRAPTRARTGGPSVRATPAGPAPTPGRLIPPDELRWRAGADELGFTTTAEVEPLVEVTAQERALDALRMAAAIEAPGYNVFCVGLTGSDRMEIVRRALCQLPPRQAPAPDRCYVANFADPEAPRLLRLPRGTARRFARDVEDLVEQLAKHLALVLDEPRFVARVRRVTEEHRRQERELLAELHERAHQTGFSAAEVEGPQGAPRVELVRRLGPHLLNLDQIETAAAEVQAGALPFAAENQEEAEQMRDAVAGLDLEDLRRSHLELSEVLGRIMRDNRRLERSLQRQVAALELEEGRGVVEGLVAELGARHADAPDVAAWLADVQQDVLENIALFRHETAAEPAEVAGGSSAGDLASAQARYRVHVVRDNAGRTTCPVVVETNPTPRNLFGTDTREAERPGEVVAEHAGIRPGSVLDADGGWLVLDAAEVLGAGDSGQRLKRTLLHGTLDLRDTQTDPPSGPAPPLRPDPIPVTTKVVMLGDEETYEYLDSVDQDFKHVFRVRAEFDWLMPRGVEGCRHVAGFIRRLGDTAGLLPFAAAAVARVAEHAARLAEQPAQMVSRFDLVADVVRQAALQARQAGAPVVERSHVSDALAAARRRCALGAERLRDAIRDGRLMIATTGTRVGQVNALAVRRTIEHAFGHPLRVTAVVSRGTSHGILSIEREVQMSGSLHDKGVFVAAGYLAQRYGRDLPLSFSASVAFEQLYGGIEGDSASSAVIYALLSALGRLPVAQSIAVTGSVNQFGEIQAVGGVNEKVEGFFDACVAQAGAPDALDGSQGVLVPAANAGELMLRTDVVEAVCAGRFHVRAIATVDEGISVLTGLPAGTAAAPSEAGRGTVHGEVVHALARFAEDDAARGGAPTGPAIAQHVHDSGKPGQRHVSEP
jgi:ATP-dependent Lon protease